MAIKPKPSATAEALKAATAALSGSQDDYRNHLLASGAIREALARAASDSDPTLGQFRTAKADVQKKLGTVFSDSMDLQDITDPRMREAIRERRSAEYGSENEKLGGLISDRQGSQDKMVDKFSSVFGALTGAKQFDVTQKEGGLNRATGEAHREEDRANQMMDVSSSRKFDSRFDDLTRREKEAQIAASNRSNRGGGGVITLEDQVKNPLLAFLSATGGKGRVQQKGGGFDFFDKSGKPITVEQAAAMVPGATKADLLSGKPPSDAQMRTQTSAISGLQSVQEIEKLLQGGITKTQLASSRNPVGAFLAGGKAQTYRNAARNAADVLARLRTGAAINDQELKLYTDFVPGSADDPGSARQKLSTLKLIFNALANGRRLTARDLQGGAAQADPSSYERP
jgi:hypothetical protein